MRHLLSFLLSVILAPLIFVSAGFAQVKWTEQADASWQPALYALPAILAAGLLYSVLVLVRLSPVGTFLAGLAFFGLGMWSLFEANSLQDVMPNLKELAHAYWNMAIDAVGLSRTDVHDEYFELTWAEHGVTLGDGDGE
jgi:hypothetical protein